jgi:hypothetical protein
MLPVGLGSAEVRQQASKRIAVGPEGVQAVLCDQRRQRLREQPLLSTRVKAQRCWIATRLQVGEREFLMFTMRLISVNNALNVEDRLAAVKRRVQLGTRPGTVGADGKWGLPFGAALVVVWWPRAR